MTLCPVCAPNRAFFFVVFMKGIIKMARNARIEKIEEYLKKHSFARRWISIMVVMSLLVTCVTLYAMNRGASAVTEEGADEIGMVLDENAKDSIESSEDGQIFDENANTSETYEDGEETGDESESVAEENSESEDSSNQEDGEQSEDGQSDDAENTENLETSDNTDNTDNTDEDAGSGDGENTENTDSSDTTETVSDNENADKGLEKDIELTKDVKLTVSYKDVDDNLLIDEEGVAYADEKEAHIEENMIFPDDARTIEGYEFKKVLFDELEIKEIIAKKFISSDESEYVYYEIISEEEPPYDEFEQNEDGKYVSYLKEDTNLIFVYEKNDSSDDKEKSESGKINEEDIPESVDLSEYVTETVIERLTADGTWEAIDEADIKLGDHLRITVKYSMPAEASLSDDIHLDVPEKYGNVISSQSDLENGEGTFEATDDNKIILNYSDEYKKEKLEEPAKEPTDEDESNEDFFSSIIGLFDEFTIVAHAAEGNNGMTSGTLSYETIVDSTDLGGMKITEVSVRKNPKITHNADGTNSYSGGTQIPNGSKVSNGEGLIFRLGYMLEIGTVSPQNPSVTYALSKHGILVDKAASGYVYNGNNEEVGTFTIDESGLITITFHDEFASKNERNIIDDSYFYFYATANADSDKDETEKVYDFGNDVTFTVIVVNKKVPDLSIDKKILEDYKKETGTIKYQVVISSVNGTESDVKFTDGPEVYNDSWTDKSYSQELTGSFTMQDVIEHNFVKKRADGKTEPVNISDLKSPSANLGKLEAGESFILTYKLRVPKKIAEYPMDLILKNVATATFGNNETRRAEVSSKLYGYAPSTFKSGVVDNDKREVTWTITINENHVNLKDYTLYDFTRKFEKSGWGEETVPYTGNITVEAVRKANGQSYSTFQKGNTFFLDKNGYTFTRDDYSTYILKYTYKFTESDIVYGHVKNEVRLYHKITGKGNNAIGYAWVGDFTPLTKSAAGVKAGDNGTAQISWQITLNAPITRNEGRNNSEYWTFYDEILEDNEVFTSKDIDNLKTAIRSIYGGKFVVSTKNSRSVGNISGYKEIEIKFYDDIKNTVSFTYTTTGTAGDGRNEVRFANRAAVYNKTIYGRTADQSFRPFIKKYDGKYNQGDSTYDYNTDDTYKQGILTWIVEVNIPSVNDYENLYVIDKLPDRVSLIENGTYGGKYLYGIEVADNNNFNKSVGFEGNTAERSGVTYKRSGDNRNVIINFNGKAVAGKRLYFKFHAKIDSDFDFKSVGTGVFTNNAILSKDSNGSDILGNASQTQRVTRTEYAMTKTSKVAEGSLNTIEYCLDVNEKGADLLPGGDSLTLKDTFTAKSGKKFSTYLVPDSVKVYVVTTGENGQESESELSAAEYSYTISTYDTTAAQNDNGQNDLNISYSNVVFSIPDEKHLRIRYRYTFNGEDNTEVDLSNNAKLEGVSIDKDSANNSRKVKIQDAGARANVRGVNLYKVDAENSGTLLPGAVFSLYYYDGRDWILQKNEKSEDGKFTTDSNGFVAVAPLKYNVGYKLVEDIAPKGYIKDNTPVCFYITSADIERYPLTLPADFFTALGGCEFAAGQPVYVKNHKDSTSITVKKEWVGADDVTKPSSVFVKVGRRLGNPQGKAGDTAFANYYNVNIERRNLRNTIKQYIGYPSVKSGSQLSFTFYTYSDQYYKDPVTVLINGEKLNYTNELNASGVQAYTKTITITGNTTIQIIDSNSVGAAHETTASLSLPKETAIAPKDEGGLEGLAVGAEDTSFTREITITAVDGWKATLSDLDRYYTDEKTGTRYEWLYYVSEAAGVYYTADYSENNTPGINTGMITITNTRNEVTAYALPSTGGMGQLPFTIAGLSLATIALLGEEYVRRKRRKEK